MSDISGNAAAMGTANSSQMSGSMLIQTYVNSVLQQPKVDFSGTPSLELNQKQINDGLDIAQNHAKYYMNTLHPNLIKNMGNISNYYQLNKTLPIILPEGSTVEQWVKDLSVVREQSIKYCSDAKQMVNDLHNFSGELAKDSQGFSTIVSQLNNKLNGDEGVLNNIKEQLDSFQHKIDQDIAGIALSSFMIGLGGITICVGAIESFITAGTSTPLILSGIGIVATGIGGDAAAIVDLINSNNAKGRLLSLEANLEAEVKLAAGISSGYSSLSKMVQNAITAATGMANAWENVGADLDQIIDDLTNGIAGADDVRTLFIAAANGEISTLLSDIQIVKQQMSGVTVQCAATDQTVSQLIASLAG
ncbi:HBL/NHE enterotoxin family protein [Serratia fonticola]|uniref:HBL/NHE enterotoxin family protein n=1 Tax=Serratia fonticola TaxID=47917 RepID=UPI001AE426F1|nr:HBL/NHE enterotoxin family protein [Serratia fonticola]MBP0997520.1 HBL/NHE enterotoxin family protein [Serratia fonticola]MBP1003189.1 HBL/NHE enterotoxin family protein [Serratia fonticola]MBP1013072.1 HBL/NHE enterotoxin family protein [Serratia fonticola]CAI0828549.1 Bacillus haemolytic enterotoxin (HBL) [Serratia fonticola]